MTDMPTSPVNPAPATNGPDTLAAGTAALPASLPAAANEGGVIAEWRRVGAFIKRPRLIEDGAHTGALKTLGAVYALDLVIMSVLLAVLGGLIAAGVELPRTAIADMEITLGLAALVVIGAPVMEELMFRSWLNGRPGWLVSLLILAVSAIAASVWAASSTGQTASAGVAVIMIAAILVCGAALFFLRNRPAPGWFKMLFPGLFWLSAAGFALIHIANFADQAWWVVLPLVTPQLILGALAGYVRVRLALWAAIALHAAHNATMLGIATLASAAS